MIDKVKIRAAIKAQIAFWNSEGDCVSGLEAMRDAFINLRWRMESTNLNEALNQMLKLEEI